MVLIIHVSMKNPRNPQNLMLSKVHMKQMSRYYINYFCITR
jgi:hypothetical protein